MDFLDLATVTETPEQIAAKVLPILSANARELIEQLIAAYNANIDACWSNEHFSPEVFAAAAGTAALSMFQRSGALKAFILSQDPTAVDRLRPFPAAYDWPGGVIIDGDGIATLTKKPLEI